jgi:hypothetical protein
MAEFTSPGQGKGIVVSNLGVVQTIQVRKLGSRFARPSVSSRQDLVANPVRT